MKVRKIVDVCLAVFFAVACARGQVSVLTQHNDNARTGQNLNESTLNTSNVNQNTFGKLFWRTVDGFIYAQPLYVQALEIQGANHNVVYVATQHNSVYAFDADDPNSPAPLWQVNLGTPVPSQDICIITGDTNPVDCPYYDISPEIGITSTPVIDPTAAIIYVVARTKSPDNTYHFFLHALSLTSGSEELSGPIEITGQVNGTGNGSVNGILTFDPTYHLQRPSLLLQNGVLYIAFGSQGDIGTWHGWVMSYNASTLQQEAVFNVAPDGNEGGIWSAGQGLVSDSSGSVYTMTGNGDFNANVQGGRNYGDSFVKFGGSSLNVLDYFTPMTQASLNSDNSDLGAGGPMLVPGTTLLVGEGKDGIMRVVNSTNMGKYNSAVDNDVQEFSATPGPFFSSPIYWNSPNHGPVIYLWNRSDNLKAFQFSGSTFNTTPVSQGTILGTSGFSNAAALSLSANQSLGGSGIVWANMPISGTATGTPIPGALWAYDATDLTSELWDSTKNPTRDGVGNYAKFVPPTVANGKVYLASFSGQLQVYGLNPPAFQGIQFVQAASATPQSTSASVALAYSSVQAAGDLNVVIVGWHDTTASVQSVTDSAGNTYSLAIGPTRGNGLSESIYYAKNILGNNSNTVTVTFTQGAAKPDVRILEYSGADASNPLDVTAGAFGNSNIANSGSVATNAANELLVGADMVASGNTTVMAGAPYNMRAITTTDSDLAADRLVNVPGAYYSWAPLNTAGPWIMQMVTFKSATVSTVPFVSTISPSSGSTAGGTSVTITGTNFAAGATVTFGIAAATNVTVVNSTTITATTPGGSAGAVTVTVTNSNGLAGSLTNGFTYAAPPTVTSVSPNNGSTSGGTPVTITGTNFASGATVTFGSASATNVVVVNSTTITVTTPAGSAGAVTVRVTVSGQSGSLANGFTYVVRPTVTSVSPNSGPVAGGTSVTITGTNFASGATVTFGSASATSVTVVNGTTITATTPAGSAGAVTVTVTVSGQSGSLASGFTYIGQPTVSSVSPNNGPATGGTGVTITGTNFATGATVTFGSAAATNVVVASSTSITATTPAGSVGAVTVTVTNAGNQTGSLANGFTYSASAAIGFAQVAAADPQTPSTTVSVTYPAAQTLGDLNIVVVGWNDTTSTVQSVKDSVGNTYNLAVGPTSGTGLRQSIYYAPNIAGGSNTVTVTFSQAATYPDIRILEYRGVTALDKTAAASGSGTTASSGSATTTSANELIFAADTIATTTNAAGTGFTARIITSPDSDLAEDKVVTTAGSQSATATLSSGAWVMQMTTFAAVTGPAPTVTGVSPSSGSTAGGTSVTITGTNFASGATVTFGSAAATNVTVVNSTTITATTPAGTAGATAVKVTAGGQSGSLASGFTYVAPPTVTSLSPNSGLLTGGTSVTITGTNFASGATVTFGSTSAISVTVVNSTTITATTPVGSPGAVTVTVTNSNGLAGSLANGFTYAAPPTVTSVSPNNGSNLGGTPVSLTGTNFISGDTVTFGGTAATNVTVVNSTTITVTTPAGSTGAVTVTVSDPFGQTGSLTNGYTYVLTTSVTAPGNVNAALVGISSPSYVSGQQYYNSTSLTSHTTSPFNSTGADLLVIFIGCHNNTVFTVTDSFGNTWLPLAGPSATVGSQDFPLEGELFYAPNAKTGTNHTITVALSQSEPLIISIAAIAGDNIYSPVDAYSPITPDNGTLSSFIYSSPLTTFQPNDFLLGIVKGFQNKTFTAGTGYANQAASTGLNFGAETGTASTTGAYSTNFTASEGDYWQSALVAIAPKPNQTTLSWTASVGGPITNYFVERCPGIGCSSFAQIASLSGSTLTYTDASISSGTAYSYRLRAENSSGMFSGYSTVQTVSPIIPTVVSSLAANALKALAWNVSAESGGTVSNYSIERCQGVGCSAFSQVATTTSTNYTDSSASAGNTYNYRVRAMDTNGIYGPYSAVAAINIPAYLDNATDGGNNGGTTSSLTYPYSVGTNTNRLLVVNVVGSPSVDDISSVTYGGASLTLIKKIEIPGGNWHYLYDLVSPPSGTNNVVVRAASSHYLSSEACSWYNIGQSSQPQTSATNTSSSNQTLTATLPASTNNAIAIESMWAPNQVLPGNGSTELIADAASQTLGFFSSLTSPVTSAYPLTMTNTWGGEQPASSITASFLLASNGIVGITFDNAADGGNNGGSTTSLSYTYSVGSGSNRLLIVNLIGSTSVDDISTVTYAGVPMTLLSKVQAPSNAWQYLYYLISPASGSNTVAITAASAHYLLSQAASWSGVKQSTQPDASTTNTSASAVTSTTTSLTTIASGSLVVEGVWSDSHLAAGQGATPVIIEPAFDAGGIFASTNSPVAPGGNVSMTTISDGTMSTSVIMASFSPAQ